MKRARLFTCSFAVGILVLVAIPAFSQPAPQRLVAQASPGATRTPASTLSPLPTTVATATATISKSAYGSANWTKYLAYVLGGVAVMVMGMAALGWLIQAPGFRRVDEDSE
jgi:hypothetical protein